MATVAYRITTPLNHHHAPVIRDIHSADQLVITTSFTCKRILVSTIASNKAKTNLLLGGRILTATVTFDMPAGQRRTTLLRRGHPVSCHILFNRQKSKKTSHTDITQLTTSRDEHLSTLMHRLPDELRTSARPPAAYA